MPADNDNDRKPAALLDTIQKEKENKIAVFPPQDNKGIEPTVVNKTKPKTPWKEDQKEPRMKVLSNNYKVK